MNMNKFQALWKAIEGTEYARSAKLMIELGDAMGANISACLPHEGPNMRILIRHGDGRKAELSLPPVSHSAHKFLVDPTGFVEAISAFPTLPRLIEELAKEVDDHPVVDVVVRTRLRLRSTQPRTEENFKKFLGTMNVGKDLESFKRVGVSVEDVLDFQVEVI